MTNRRGIGSSGRGNDIGELEPTTRDRGIRDFGTIQKSNIETSQERLIARQWSNIGRLVRSVKSGGAKLLRLEEKDKKREGRRRTRRLESKRAHPQRVAELKLGRSRTSKLSCIKHRTEKWIRWMD
ncbi:hypothetical protein PoB_001740800 [Plakobranchus ocellatus]|uniref:Uncharacterized protein n=1 Tax=Plakobranchus ocellatus TaxID=259542 RepID=A0AAV3Z835_9GAST|nr:hypothetical protein PoB_001740800 [Plakobranchus ocellatus]